MGTNSSVYDSAFGLDKKVKLILEEPKLGLGTSEVKNLNQKIREEQKKFPHLDVSALAAKSGKEMTVVFKYTPRPARTKLDQIDDLIKKEKSKLKKR